MDLQQQKTDYEAGWKQGYSAAVHTMVDLLKFGGKDLEADQIMKAFVESGELMKTHGASTASRSSPPGAP